MTWQGRRYALIEGRLVLDWRDKTTLTHPQGCRPCCTIRIRTRPATGQAAA